ncbi:MAG TPA: M48 family metalloprotease [Patescibacteria group bacterium]|nr:M48 family metalloprotease [Patescibacteria group bacterium]
MRVWGSFSCIVSLVLLSGCVTVYNPATEKQEFIFINSATESLIGKNVSAGMLQQHPAVDDPRLQERIKRIGSRIAQVCDRQDIGYTFTVVTDKELNAVTLPGGFIYINKGLVDILSDDEIAYVLGHEAAHMAARHIVKKLQANMAYQVLMTLAFTGMGNRAGDSAGVIAQGAHTVYNLVQLKYSRDDEYAADTLGVKYAWKAGFDPNAALSALQKLKQSESEQKQGLSYFRTHPYVDDRIKAIRGYIPALNQAQDRH